MRILLSYLSVAAFVTALAVSAFAQDKPANDPPPANPNPGAAEKPAPANPDQPPPAGGTGAKVEANVQQLTGKVVSAEGGQVVIRNEAGKEFTFFPTSQTRFTIDNQPARFADFRVGSTVNVGYVVQGDRYVLNSMVIGAVRTQPPAPAPKEEGTLVEGTVVKVVGNDQVVVKTSDGKEITIYVSPQTKYTLTETGGAFVDLQPAMPIRTYYDTVERRPVARRILRGPAAPPRPIRP